MCVCMCGVVQSPGHVWLSATLWAAACQALLCVCLCIYVCVCVYKYICIWKKWKWKWLSLCPTLCDPMDYSPPSSSVHGILQARILEWVAIPFSRGSSRPRDQTWGLLHCSRFFTFEPPGKPVCMCVYVHVCVCVCACVCACVCV